ncbi:hypothetical protein FOA43_004262 [Brettanomyces nanus]|uniref:UBA domain-containing protein n=1 Tax=Eeniella nana TaxID=13502 RepID=A0A875S7D8_EENNA|nr:uncharacterized protein FOA43_004262 [Brettanomyces nanus]QPG76868.1 hypothetical protein FOA43_004262 [Brettanomyces nanus]
MRFTILVDGTDQILTTDLPGDFEIADFMAYIESETDIKPQDQVHEYEGRILPQGDKYKMLSDWILEEEPLVILKKKKLVPAQAAVPAPVASAGSIGSIDSPFVNLQIEQLRQQFIQNPSTQYQLDRKLRESINDKELFKSQMMELMMQKQQAEIQQKQEMDHIYANPDDPDNQKKIMQLIRQQAIDENMKMAYEESPESFTQVHMLYINCEVNGVAVKAFVDSGAQMTIISPDLAIRCGLDKLIDRRFIGEARGVGSAKIEGRVHSAPLKIEGGYFSCSFTVIASQVEMLLGLDMLRRFRAKIDLEKNKLVIGEVETSFLPEIECPNELNGEPGHGFGGNLFSRETPMINQLKKPAKRAKKQKSPKVIPDALKVDQLVAMGFDRKQAELALIQTQNNIELAAGMLFD